jgi:hypothetical protein
MNFRERRTKSRAADAAGDPADASRLSTNAVVYTDGRTSNWRITAIPGAAMTARHPEVAKKELETIGARRRKAISTEEIRRRARIFS